MVEQQGRTVGYASSVGYLGHAVAAHNDALKALIGAAPSLLWSRVHLADRQWRRAAVVSLERAASGATAHADDHRRVSGAGRSLHAFDPVLRFPSEASVWRRCCVGYSPPGCSLLAKVAVDVTDPELGTDDIWASASVSLQVAEP